MSTRISRTISLPAAGFSVAVVTVIFKAFIAVNATTVGFAYLITILLIAAWSGIAESIFASIAATICFNVYFLPPFGTWVISDPENWVALCAFLIASLIASELSRRARRRSIEMERLYSLGRSIMLMNDNAPIGDQIAKELARVCEIPAVAICDARSDTVHYAGSNNISDIEPRLRETALEGAQSKDEMTGIFLAPIVLGGETIGSIALQGEVLADTALQALLNLVAIALENARSREAASRSQAAQQSQEFKSTLLDGLAHEFKTPLTSIRAATTALLASNISNTARHELTLVVDQEVDRLGRLVTEATHIARVEAGHIQLNRQWTAPGAIVERVLADTEVQRDGRRVDVSTTPQLPPAFVDSELVQLALRQLVENALKYSLRGTTIRISSRLSETNLLISVENQGEPLSEAESSRIFDKFYRGQNIRRQVAGTGMGLPVAREILLAHGGDIVLQRSDEQGTEFVLTIPTDGM